MDWKAIPPADLYGMTGTAEYRVERDGLIRWKGLVTRNDSTIASAFIQNLPVEAQRVAGPTHIEWTANPPDHNSFPSGSLVYIGFYGVAGQVFDLSELVWFAAIPPAPEHTLANVLIGLREALQNIAKLRVYDFPSSKIEPPAAVLSLPETPYDVTLGGRSDEWNMPLWILVSKGDDRSAYKEMTPYLEAEGERSIRAMIEADRTLGGACDTCAVINARPQFASVGGVEFLAIEFTLEVYT